MKKGGRPIKLNDHVKKALLDSITAGMNLKGACECAGISYSTLAHWVRKGKKDRANNQNTIYAFITKAVETAVAHFKLKHKIMCLSTPDPFNYRYGRGNINSTLLQAQNIANSLNLIMGDLLDES